VGRERINKIKAKKNSQMWWLMPVILATQDVAIRRIMVRSQPWINSLRDPIS
jgi:hypothetical protein